MTPKKLDVILFIPIGIRTSIMGLLPQITPEFPESDVSPGKTDVKQGKVQFISPAKGYFRETYKSENIKHFSPTPRFTLGVIQIKVKSLSTSFQ